MTPLPVNPYRFVQILQHIFHAQARDVLTKMTLEHAEAGAVPELTPWVKVTADATRHLVLQLWQQGILRSRQRIQAKLTGLDHEEPRRHVLDTADIFGRAKGVMWSGDWSQHEVSDGHAGWSSHVTKAGRAPRSPLAATRKPTAMAVPVRPSLSTSFDLFNPKILDAVDEATMRFCRETNETARTDLKTALRDLRHQLKLGLKRGEAVQQLARRTRRIFADPMRAFRIAATESSRAIHAGALYSAKESGVVKLKVWLASADACERCLDLDGKSVKLDKPFFVDKNGGPYAIVQHPPLHPHCVLPETPVVAPETIVALKSFYAGPCFRITMGGGNNLSCTPNHMLLTARGFVKASDLVQGDDILHCAYREWPGRVHPDDDRQPTKIKDVFDSLSVASGLPGATVVASPEYLHGDAAFCKGYINVVKSESLLWNRYDLWESEFEHPKKSIFEDGHQPLGLDGCSQLSLGRFLHGLASLCRVGRSSDPSSFFRSDDGVGFFFGPGLDTGHFEVDQDGSCTTAVLLSERNCAPSLSVEVGDLIRCGIVKLLPVGHMSLFRYEGPVYDLSTRSSLYLIGSGVVSSNCMCDMEDEI